MTVGDLYSISILAGAVTTTILACCMFFSAVPAKEVYAAFDRSRRLLALGYAVYAAGIWVYVFFPIREQYPFIAPALNLTYYFAASFLFGLSFISLLEHKYISRERIRRFAVTYCLYVILLWATVFLTNGKVRVWLLECFGFWFIVQCIILIRTFFSTYRKARNNIDNYYSDSTALFVNWLMVSAWMVMICGFAGGVLPFLPGWCNAIYMAIGIIAFTYIYISMQNYILNFEIVEKAVNPIPESFGQGEEPSQLPFVASLDRWVKEEGYTEAGINIQKLAKITCTNRSYLSVYINERFGKNYSDWINSMRVDKACAMLLSPLTSMQSLEQIAYGCGFASQAYFSRIFKRYTGLSPSDYRNKNNNK